MLAMKLHRPWILADVLSRATYGEDLHKIPFSSLKPGFQNFLGSLALDLTIFVLGSYLGRCDGLIG